MDFIFMLTRDDKTVPDCLDVFDSIEPLGLKHCGFKDVGVDLETLFELNRRIQASGAVSYLEVVSETEEACLASARAALEIGVNRLMGGTAVDEILTILDGANIEFFPFPGRPMGHPTELGGTPKQIEEDCRRFEDQGCHGVDLLAYRAVEANPLELIRSARRALNGYLIIAGNVDSPQRIQTLIDEGVDAFTIGSAAFNGSFTSHNPALRSQLEAILSACGY